MSNLIIILGESGTGKSTSYRNLNPSETFIINVLNKPLPFRGYKKLYNSENKNYLESDQYLEIMSYLKAINERRPDINSVIIDDFTFLMNNEFMRRCKERSFDKFNDMGSNMFHILDMCSHFRDDLFCFFICHTEKDVIGLVRPRTVGKMTADYVGISERATVVLHSQVHDGEYKFLTQCDGIHMAKSSMGMFDDILIDNDLVYVKKCVIEYSE